MIVRFPDYYKDFKCTASKCSDNCCIGWEIDIDKKTLEYYQSVGGKIGEKLCENISLDGETASFILKNNRCPFLNDENLCDIIINLSKEHLCEICREHPRFNEWFGKEKETGLGLCCEEAARLVLSKKDKTTFYEETTDEPETKEKPCFQMLKKSRDKIFEILQNRDKKIGQRIIEVIVFSEIFQAEIDSGRENVDFDYIYSLALDDLNREKADRNLDFTEKIFDVLDNLEYMQNELLTTVSSAFEHIRKNGFKCMNKFTEFMSENNEFENIMVYIVFRYYLKAVNDMRVLEKIKGIVLFMFVILILEYEKWFENNQVSELKDRIYCVKLFSKEIEYSEENLNMIEDNMGSLYSEDLIGFIEKTGM
ncbi:MAG: flagellin lysine-N-methylase [Clostridia bacterium]|jgi:lysine-N-methylase|nr:flagellin lysine-N-methylase [Clostridia bacterium]MCI2001072.1 flagellin lysine-N-methylase [Clostridia bacterium]MCI2015802.1 flagellin lysine-N-methylase [Clostridia bacterium]